MNTKNEQTFVTNCIGIAVKRCCASCMHKRLSSTSERTCSLHDMQEVEQSHVCLDWAMAECFEKAGCSLGKVKSKPYLTFVMMRRWTENKNIELGVMTDDDRQTVEELREEFIGKYGKIYV